MVGGIWVGDSGVRKIDIFIAGFCIVKHLESFKCNFCDKKFTTHNILGENMKILHYQFVSNCKNYGECKFGPRKCWFLHQEDIKNAYKNAKQAGAELCQAQLSLAS